MMKDVPCLHRSSLDHFSERELVDQMSTNSPSSSIVLAPRDELVNSVFFTFRHVAGTSGGRLLALRTSDLLDADDACSPAQRRNAAEDAPLLCNVGLPATPTHVSTFFLLFFHLSLFVSILFSQVDLSLRVFLETVFELLSGLP